LVSKSCIDGVLIHGANGSQKEIQAKLVIGADGRQTRSANSPASPPKLAGHEFVISDFSTGRGYNLIERLMLSAAARSGLRGSFIRILSPPQRSCCVS
jgi:hypothetical protein